MGTDNIPSENEWNDYITKNGRLDNAYTDIDKTVYYFKIKYEALERALDRFAQFFISPKFNKDSIDLEINAIISEFIKFYEKSINKVICYPSFTSITIIKNGK